MEDDNIITNLQPNGYKEGDKVTFWGPNGPRYYEVDPNHLRGVTCSNDQIFIDLGMTDTEKAEFCFNVYGYKTTSYQAIFPPFKTYDYEALVKIIKAIEHECDKRQKYGLHKYNINNMVRLRADSEFVSQGEGTTGRIVELINDKPLQGGEPFMYKVLWGNGHANSYRESDLERFGQHYGEYGYVTLSDTKPPQTVDMAVSEYLNQHPEIRDKVIFPKTAQIKERYLK